MRPHFPYRHTDLVGFTHNVNTGTPKIRMNGEKKGLWGRGATDQKKKRTNGYLSVEVRGFVASGKMAYNQ